MKIGICTGNNPERAKIAGELGFDFAELGVNGYARMSDEEFAAFHEGMVAAGIPCEAANGFVPGDIKLVGDAADAEVIRAYITQAMKRSDMLGIKTIVFGSGGARRIPEGMSREDGVAEIAEFLREIVSPEAAKYGIQIAIEPLRKHECNAVNTVDDGIALADAVGRENISVLADLHHMTHEGEELTSIAGKKGRILHVHSSYSEAETGGRRYPKLTDDFDQFPFMNAAYQAGCPRYSLEAGHPGDFREDAEEALAVFRQAYARITQN
ncbi:MAG: sugar phosphate isomerase/epimerase [Oscillospiraceae bacterium]|nr:sugar phosphate isomerase/epimerase [Oscillospiraceae bacterium]